MRGTGVNHPGGHAAAVRASMVVHCIDCPMSCGPRPVKRQGPGLGRGHRPLLVDGAECPAPRAPSPAQQHQEASALSNAWNTPKRQMGRAPRHWAEMGTRTWGLVGLQKGEYCGTFYTHLWAIMQQAEGHLSGSPPGTRHRAIARNAPLFLYASGLPSGEHYTTWPDHRQWSVHGMGGGRVQSLTPTPLKHFGPLKGVVVGGDQRTPLSLNHRGWDLQ